MTSLSCRGAGADLGDGAAAARAAAGRAAVAATSAAVAAREAGEPSNLLGSSSLASFVSQHDQQRITEAIAAAERRTSGEIVAVIAPSSGTYLYVPFLWAGIVALVVAWPLVFWTWWPVQHIYLVQVATFLGVAGVLFYRPLRLLLVPRSVKHDRAHKRAVEQFLTQSLHTTSGRTGVMIFVSVAERYAEILADQAIHTQVAAATWQQTVDELTQHIGNGEPGEGFVCAIAAVGSQLASYFPPAPRDPNELSNHLIILPAD